MAFVVVKNCHHFRLPGQLGLPRGRLCQTPGVEAAGYYVQDLAQLLDGIKRALLVNKLQRTHGVGGCEKRTMAFFKMSGSCANRLLAARNARTSAASVGSAGTGGCAAFCQA